MASLTPTKFSVAKHILGSQKWLNSIFSPPVRQHVGYIAFEGLLHPMDTELTRINRQVKRINLKPVKRMHFAFDPFHPSVKSIRHVLFHFSSEKIRGTNPKCIYKTDILTDRSEPTMKVELAESNENVGRFVFKTANLKTEEVLAKFNETILPLVKDEVEDERTTKGAKMTAATKGGKKAKGGK